MSLCNFFLYFCLLHTYRKPELCTQKWLSSLGIMLYRFQSSFIYIISFDE